MGDAATPLRDEVSGGEFSDRFIVGTDEARVYTGDRTVDQDQGYLSFSDSFKQISAGLR